MNPELSMVNPEPVASQAPAAFPASVAAPHTPSFLRQIYQFVALTAMAMASYAFISHFVIQSVEVVGVSMVPTLHNSDRYFLNRWIYYFHAPKRGDLVVIKDPSDGGYAVKRIVGLPGDAIYFSRGAVYANGKKLSELYLDPGTKTYPVRSKDSFVACGKGSYFVMGDNRGNSLDSRTYGPVPRANILGSIIR